MIRPLTIAFLLGTVLTPNSPAFWNRHTIDAPDKADGKSGADGVRLADANSDGLMDITTGWEEGGAVRVYLNPGPENAKLPWPAVTVGHAKSVEDAVFTDLDNDGNLDVVSSTEGKNRTVYVHWAPEPSRYLDPQAWTTQAIPATAGKQMWMFALPRDIDGKNGVDVVLGSKGENASIGWLESPPNPRDVTAWKHHQLHAAVWIMSIRAVSKEQGLALLYSDRKGPDSGVFELTQTELSGEWTRRPVLGSGTEVMFLDLPPKGDAWFEAPDSLPAIVARKNAGVLLSPNIDFPLPKNAGTGKAVRLLGNGFVLTCENANGRLSGVWLFDADQQKWTDISGPEGVKFDRIELLDLDADGDLDLITCEERAGLGVVWFENPGQ
jgi:hypothetical protein